MQPSAAALRATMQQAGLVAVAGDNDVFGGITRVQKRLVLEPDGTPRLTVSPTCRHLIEELGVYEWMDGRDKPRKVHDHACDALRYAVMYLDERRPIEVRLLGGGRCPGSGGSRTDGAGRAWWDDRPGVWRELWRRG